MTQYFFWWGMGNGTLFEDSPQLAVGVMPPLVLSLRLMGHTIEQLHLSEDATHLHIRTNRSGDGTGPGASASASAGAAEGGADAAPVHRSRVDYFSRTIALDPEVWATQLAMLRHTVLGEHGHVATFFKAAEGLKWAITRPTFMRWVLDVSAAVVQDETGLRPSGFDGGWVVRTFGNHSELARSYRCLGMDANNLNDGLRFGVGREEALALRMELHDTFQGGTRDLPFPFGYAPVRCLGGPSGAGPPATGLMLTAWRSSLLSAGHGE